MLLKTIIGLLRPTSGHVVFDGQRIDQLGDKELTALRGRFGFVFQNAALFDSMTVAENVAFPLRENQPTCGRNKIRADRRASGSTQVGLPPSVLAKRPAQLSGGMRKRVGLARALAMNPEVLLYDEPTTGLDPIMSDVINELIMRTREAATGDQHRRHARHEERPQSGRPHRDALSAVAAGADEPQIIFDGTPQEIMRIEGQARRPIRPRRSGRAT